jgi:hypothetical protein
MRNAMPLLLTLFLTTASPAADRTSADVRSVAPFLDEQTVGVLRVDVTRLDVPALGRKLIDIGALKKSDLADATHKMMDVRALKKAPAGPGQQIVDASGLKEAGQAEVLADVERAVADFRKAGGKEVYAVFSLADMTPSSPFFVVIPVAEKADGKALRELAGRVAPFQGVAFEQIGRALVGGSEATLQRLRGVKPVSFPGLEKAFAAAGDTTVQLVGVLSRDNRRVIAETLPDLPEEVTASTEVITKGLEWAAVGADLAPELSLRLVLQARDPKAARDLEALAHKALDLVGQAVARQPEGKRAVPHADRLLGAFKPRAQGDRVTMSMGDHQLTAALRPVVSEARKASARMQSMNNLKQIVLALHNYHDTYNGFPMQAIYSKDGKPLLSWRVAILPFIEQQELYRQFHLDEPWDSEHNKKLIARMPAVFRSSAKLAPQHKTTYVGVVGKKTMFPGAETVMFRDVTDGTSLTIFVVDTNDDHGVIWTRPEDLPYDVKDPVKALTGHFPGGFIAAFVDGSVQFIKDTISAKRLRALFTRNGGENVTPPWEEE